MDRPRKSRCLELTLLLAVAPLVMSCDDAEERHCVGQDGVYLDDRECEAPPSAGGGHAHWVYVPRRHYRGVGHHAGGYVHATSPSRGGSSSTARGGFGGTGAHHGTAHGG